MSTSDRFRPRRVPPPAPDEQADGPDADPDHVARAIVLRQLTLAPRTRAQLEDTLRRRLVPDDVARTVLDRFAEVGLIDDTAYAQAWVRSRHDRKGLARRALANELRRRGVDDEIVDGALAQLDTDVERERARQLAARKLRSTRGLDVNRRVSRVSAMLARKGYPASVVNAAVRDALSDEASEESSAQSAEWPAGRRSST